MTAGPLEPAGDPGALDPRRALQEVIRLAEDDRRRGIRFWFDAGLVSSLRDTVRDVSGEGAAPRAQAAAPRRVAPASRPVPHPSRPAVPPASVVPTMPPASTGSRPPTMPTPSSGSPLPTTPTPSAGSRPPALPPADEPARPAAARPTWGPPPEPTGRTADWEARLDALAAAAAGCTACRLCETRHTVVFASGRARVPLVFVGEAPGHDEDLQGEAFVGRAGQLLTKIIDAIGLTREQVYICNVLKCRPPENRNPMPDEIVACRHYLEEQLEILQPKVICTLGLFAAQLLLGSTAPIGKLRGRLFTEGRWPILPTFHPAYLLRNPSAKATVWGDVQQLRTYLDS